MQFGIRSPQVFSLRSWHPPLQSFSTFSFGSLAYRNQSGTIKNRFFDFYVEGRFFIFSNTRLRQQTYHECIAFHITRCRRIYHAQQYRIYHGRMQAPALHTYSLFIQAVWRVISPICHSLCPRHLPRRVRL